MIPEVKAEWVDANRDAHLFKEYEESPQWKRLVELMERYIRQREVNIVYGTGRNEEDCRDIDDIDRGWCEALQFMKNLPSKLRETALETLDKIDKLEDNEHESE